MPVVIWRRPHFLWELRKAVVTVNILSMTLCYIHITFKAKMLNGWSSQTQIVWLQLTITCMCVCVCVCACVRACTSTHGGGGSIKNATYARQWWPASKDFCHLSINHIRNIKQYRGKLTSYYKLCNANQMAYSEPEWNKDCNIFKSDILLWSRYKEVRMVALKHNNSLHFVKFYRQMFWIMYKEPRYKRKVFVHNIMIILHCSCIPTIYKGDMKYFRCCTHIFYDVFVSLMMALYTWAKAFGSKTFLHMHSIAEGDGCYVSEIILLYPHLHGLQSTYTKQFNILTLLQSTEKYLPLA